MKKMKGKKVGLILLITTVTTAFAFSQRTITGTVTDDAGESLIGASVLIKGTNVGTITDIDGRYSIAAPEGELTLAFSYTGYSTEEVNTENSYTIDVVLKEGIICGYFTCCIIQSEAEYWFQETQKVLAQKAELRRINTEKRRLRRIKRKEKREERKVERQKDKAFEKLTEVIAKITDTSTTLAETEKASQNPNFANLLSTTTTELKKVSVNELSQIALFPNPVAKILHVQFEIPVLKRTSIEIYDERRRLVKREVLAAQQTFAKIDLEALPTGFYVIKIPHENTNFYKKVIKQ